MGAAERELLRQGLRYSLAVRLVVVAIACFVALSMDTARQPAPALGVVLGLNAWNCWYAYRMSRGAGRWLVPADVLVMCAACLSQVWTTGSTNWVGIAASITLVAYPWQVRPLQLATATVLITVANLSGAALAREGIAPQQLWMVMEAALSFGLFVLVRHAARAADLAVERGERVRRDAAVAAARRVDEREYLAALHDTASATLLMVGSAVVDRRQPWLSDQAARDLEVMRGPAVLTGRDVDLVALLRDVAGRTPLRVSWHAPESLRVPAAAAVALSHGTREALTNVVRHAGVDQAEITVHCADRTVVVQVVDHGRGFDPASVTGHRYGLTRSLVERMARTGGGARVISAPGAGTLVRMDYRLGGSEIAHDDTELIATKFLNGLRWAVVGMNIIVLFGLDLPKLLANQDAYRSVAAQYLSWAGFLAVTVAVAVAIRRGRALGRWRWPLLALVLALSIVATESIRPEHRLTVAHWSDGDAAWTVVLLVLDCRPIVFAGAVIATYVAQFVSAALAGQVTIPLAGVVSATLIVLAYQLVVGMIAVVVRGNAVAAARSAREEERLRTSDAIAKRLHHDRKRRYAELVGTTVPVLEGLASGELDPSDEAVRRTCAVEAARMRRLLAEDGTAPDALSHELRACVELAERNGVSVSYAECGVRPAIPTAVRRSLTEPAIAALATARGKVRLTVVGAGATVTVSVVANCPAQAVPIPDLEEIETSALVDGDRLWIQSTWRGGS